MVAPSTILIIFVALFILLYPSYHYSKKKNLSIFWNLFWTLIFGPLWWIVLILRKKKDYQVFKYKNKAIID